MPDDRFAIPFALDRYRNEVTIEETVDGEDYFCPMCLERVEARKGPRLQFFAHWRNNPASFECEAHSRNWVPIREREGNLPPSEVAAEHHRMRLAVTKDPYRPRLILNGILPAAQPDEWSECANEPWTFVSTGVRGELDSLLFQPGILEAEIPLEATATTFSIQVSNGPPSLNGTWTATLNAESAFFVGDRNRAESRETLGNLWEGQIVFVPDSPKLGDMPGPLVDLGTRRFREIEIDRHTLELLRSRLGLGGLAPRGFEVRVLFPLAAPPFGLERIEAMPDERIVLGIVPPQGPGPVPSLDILELPLALHPHAAATLTGSGEVRKFEFKLGDRPSRRFDIRWNRRHVSVRATARVTEAGAAGPIPTHNVKLMYLDRQWIPLAPSHDSGAQYSISRPLPSQSHARWKLEGGLTAPVRLSFHEPLDGGASIRRDVLVRGDSIARAIDGALFDGATELRVDFGILGQVRLVCRILLGQDHDPAKLVARVIEIGLPRKHIRWSYVRTVFRLPSARPQDFPRGTKKRVRQAVMKARKQLRARG